MKLTEPMFELIARRFGALSDETRLRLLTRLRESPANVTTLAATLGIAQPSVTKHLAVLRDVGLVESTKQGAQVVYRIADAGVFSICELVCEGVIKHARQRQAGLNQILDPDRV